jgi:hypothetical protein
MIFDKLPQFEVVNGVNGIYQWVLYIPCESNPAPAADRSIASRERSMLVHAKSSAVTDFFTNNL